MVFVKGHPGYKPKGAKSKTTLLKEERRAIFDAKVSQKWEETIDKLKPEYVADQFMGATPQELKISLPKPIYGGLSKHNGSGQDIQDVEED